MHYTNELDSEIAGASELDCIDAQFNTLNLMRFLE